MTLFSVLLLSVLEGITEFLPVSSTGHLVIASWLLSIPQTDAHKSFEIAIQLGAILAAVCVYGPVLLRDRRSLLLALAGFLPTAVIGFLLRHIVKDYLLGSVAVVLYALFFGGLALIFFERFRPKKQSTASLSQMTFVQAALVGLCQCAALIPGVSRSAATIIGGELLGIERKTIVDYSFLLAIPTMAAATGWDLVSSAGSFTSGDVAALLIGFIVSFLVALFAIRFFLAFVKRHSFKTFGIYRIVIALIFGLMLWQEVSA